MKIKSMDSGFLKKTYKRALDTGFIITLIFLTLVFYFSQRGIEYKKTENLMETPEMQAIRIPRTIQRVKPRPRPLKPVIPVAADEIEILDEVALESGQTEDIGPGYLDGAVEGDVNPSIMPRQIVEVVPDINDEEVSGIIILSLQIGIDGKIMGHKVIENSTLCMDCLDEVITAALRTKWQPAVLNGEPIIFWVKKTYEIN